MAAKDDAPQLPVEHAAQWHAWLAAHHAGASGVWVVTYRTGSGRPAPTYEELVEEALCFGWIDSTAGRVDEQRTRLYFSPRRRGGSWAATNKARIERLTASGRMQPAGLAAVERAKADGSWTSLDRAESGTLPPELVRALADHPGSAAHFDAFPPGVRKQLISWVDVAKREETRVRRATEVARQAQLNVRANQQPPGSS
jgi:uncharacterized protein YdeI (YjbR/CyaY-like superfamily)